MRLLAAFAPPCLAAALLFAAPPALAESHSEDRYVGYYYPEITSEETFSRVIAKAPAATQEVRVTFVTSVTKAQLAAPENPRFVIFEKGGESRKLMIVALDDEVFKSLYRARAQLSQLTSNMRGTEFFRAQNLHVEGTLYDMLMIMGFESLVISDGVSWSHRVTFMPEE